MLIFIFGPEFYILPALPISSVFKINLSLVCQKGQFMLSDADTGIVSSKIYTLIIAYCSGDSEYTIHPTFPTGLSPRKSILDERIDAPSRLTRCKMCGG